MSPDLAALMAEAGADHFPDKIYPVETWHPELCGEMDLVIQRDGVWRHDGRPIERPALIRLFAKLLRREGADYYLVTPVEKLKINVDDLPFRIVDFDGTVFVTDQDERLTLSDAHPMVFDQVGEAYWPRLKVRGDLWARLTRPCAYRLFAEAELTPLEGGFHLKLDQQAFEIAVIPA